MIILNMKLMQIFLLICLMSIFGLMNEFFDLGGMNFKLLKIIVELIMILFIMIMVKYKDELLQIIKYDKNQKQIDHYFQKEKKANKYDY